MPILKHFNKNFFKKWSSEMAYVLGYTFADGAVYSNKRGSSYLEYTSTDLELINKVKVLLNSEHKISKRMKYNPNCKDSYRLQIGGVELLKDLEKYGIRQNKSLTVKFPIIPNKYLSSFIRGYFDGDGCVHFEKYFKKDRNKDNWVFTTDFTSGSKGFLTGLWNSIEKYVSGGYLYKKRGGYSLVFSRHDSVALFRLMYNNVSSRMFLERKYKVFLKAFGILKYNIAGVVQSGLRRLPVDYCSL